MPTEPSAGLVVRPAQAEEAERVAAVLSRTRTASVPSMPPPVHTADEDRVWLTDQLAAGAEVWVAEVGDDLVGMLLLEGEWLHSLYVDPAHQGQGIGSVLIDLAKSLRPGGLGLWVFESNLGARRLYERHGFAAVERTDGSGNIERCPDVRMVWPDPLSRLRRRIDEIDQRLAGLLAERATLTADVQRHKAVPGHAGRDRARETEIAHRMAVVAPDLGAERLGRIMDAVITESLDAANEQIAHDDNSPTQEE